MKILNNYKLNIILFATILISVSCSNDQDDSPELINEEEVITTVVLTINSTDNPTQTIRWSVDQDNSQEAISLKSNTEYQVAISFLDETDPSDIEDITEEVIEEADEHQVFYSFSNISVNYSSGTTDTVDSNGNPVYINSFWTATTIGSGTVQVFLIHEPVTKTSTTRNGFGGETDVAIDIPISIID